MRRSSNAPSHVRPNEKEIEIEKRDRYSVDTSERVEDRERERTRAGGEPGGKSRAHERRAVPR